MEAVTTMIAQKSKPAYTIKPAEGRYKVFDRDNKFRQSFATDLDARAFIAAQECAAHAKAKRTVAQVVATLAVLVILLLPEGGSGITPPVLRKRVCHQHTVAAVYHCHLYR